MLTNPFGELASPTWIIKQRNEGSSDLYYLCMTEVA